MNLRREAEKIVMKLQAAGFQAVFAGGCVRDAIMGIKPQDYDIATNATPEQIEKLFHPETLPIGEQFGVMLVLGTVGRYEVATFRTDGDYTDGRRPDSVSFSSMKEDALRRDLTINSLFYDPILEKMYDFTGGVSDINAKIIRFVGNPNDRIKEDNIRMLRAIRFATRLGFKMSPETIDAIKNNCELAKNIVPERLTMEITKILKETLILESFELLYKLGILEYTIPELLPMIGCEQPPQFHPEGDVWIHTLMVLDYLGFGQKEPVSFELWWAALFHDIGKPATAKYDEEDQRWRFNCHDEKSVEIAENIMLRLKFSNKSIDTIKDLIGNHMRMANVQKMKKAKLKRFIFKPNFNDHLLLHMADCLGSHGDFGNVNFCKSKIEEFKTETPELELPKALVDGNDLIVLGFKPGPIFKEILEYVMDGQLEDKFNSKEDGIKYLTEKYKPV